MNPKFFKSSIIFILLILFTLSSSLQAQDKKMMPEDSLLYIAHSIIDSAKCKVLITVDDEGKPQARAMATFPVDKDMIVWLGTSTDSRKVKQIKNNPNVMVYYYDSDGHSYVSLAGEAELINNPKMKGKYWKKGWERYFQDREKDYILIKVITKRMEVCSYKHKLFWDESGKPAYLEF